MSLSPVLATPASPATSPSSSPLEQLEASIKAFAGSGPSPTLDLNKLAADIPGIAPLLKRLPGSPSCLSDIILTTASESVTIAGTLTILNAPFTVNAVCTLVGKSVQLVLSGTQGANALTLLTLVEHLGHSAAHTPDVSLTDLSLRLGTDTGDFTFNGTANWAIPFGNTPSVTVTAQIALTSNTAVITGYFVVSAQMFTVTCNLAKDANSLTALWTNHAAPVTWETLVEAAGVPAGKLPSGFAGPAFTSLELVLGFSDRSLSFMAETVSGADAFLVVRKTTSGWGFILGVHQGTGAFQFESVSPQLKPLDFLSVEDAYLIAASYDDDQFVFPTDPTAANCPPPSPAIALAAGLNFGAQLCFATGAGRARTLNTLFGHLPPLSVSGSLGLPNQVSLTASLGKSVLIPKTPVQLVAPSLAVTLNGEVITADVSTEMIIGLGSGQTPLTVTGSLVINETQATLTGNAAADYTINAPFGLHGLVLQDVGVLFGLAFDPDPGFSIGLEVGFALGGDTQPGEKLALDLDISPETLSIEPVYLYGSASQPITLPLLVNTVVPTITLPAFFDEFSLSNLLISYAEPPGQKLIDGTPIAGGYAFSGTLSVFSFSMSAALNVNLGGGPKGTSGTPGVSGSFQMTPLTIHGDAVSITGVTTPGLYFAFSTSTLTMAATAKAALAEVAGSSSSTTGPMVSGQAKVAILGAASAQVFINLSSSGLIFSIGVVAGSNQLTLNCGLIQKTLTASCHLRFHIDTSFDLYVPATNEYIGKISIDADFDGSLGLKVDESGATLMVSGSFDGHTLPGGTYTASTNAMQDVAVTVIDRIRDQAKHVFTDVTSDASKWAKLVQSGCVTDANAALNNASSDFGKTYKGLEAAAQQAAAAAQQASAAAQQAAAAAQQAADKTKKGLEDAGSAIKHLF